MGPPLLELDGPRRIELRDPAGTTLFGAIDQTPEG